MIYVITFACCGGHLHGEESGSVDPAHNAPGTPILEADSARAAREMNAFKTYASRRLNRMRLEDSNRKRWARHGSTRWLWKPKHVSAAIEYVVAEQGDAMSVSESHEF